MPEVKIIMYHYVRNLAETRFPRIKGLKVGNFNKQIEYLLNNSYHFVTVEQCIEAIYDKNTDFPEKAVLLTFDDGYLEHYTEVFPILDRYGIQGAFFPPVQAIMERKLLDVNKIHFILASADRPEHLMEVVNTRIGEYAEQYNLSNPEYYKNQFGNTEHRYDPFEVVYVKRLLQRDLPEVPRKLILDELFSTFVGVEEDIFANELYMSVDQLRFMQRNGMFIGGHGYSHKWLNAMKKDEQQKEIQLTKKLLGEIGVDTSQWVMCYPYGAYDDALIDILKKSNCKMGISTTIGMASLVEKNAFTIERFDTNDLQKTVDQSPN